MGRLHVLLLLALSAACVLADPVSLRRDPTPQWRHDELRALLKQQLAEAAAMPPELTATQAMPCFACQAVDAWPLMDECEATCQRKFPWWGFACSDLCSLHAEHSGDCVAAGFCLGERINTAYRPVVIMHGVHDTSSSTEQLAETIRQEFPGIYVLNIDIGSTRMYSIYTPIDKQIDAMVEIISADPHLSDGFDIIGHSQGGFQVRGMIQRYGDRFKINNVFTIAGVVGGQFGVPSIDYWTKYLKHFLEEAAYTSYVQASIAPSNYWRDPLSMDNYVEYCATLPDLDGLHGKNPKYIANFLAVNQWAQLETTADTIVIPKESTVFGQFTVGSISHITPMRERSIYQEDLFGLKTLDQQGRLHQFVIDDCNHGAAARPKSCPASWEIIRKYVGTTEGYRRIGDGFIM